MSMNKSIKRHHRFYTKLYHLGKEFDLPFNMVVQLIKHKSDKKRIARKQKRYGYYDDWNATYRDDLGSSVKRCSKKDDEIILFTTYIQKTDLPIDKQHLWHSP